MSWRTRDAIAELGVERSMHRSHQLTDFDVDSADVVVCLRGRARRLHAPHPDAAGKTVSLKRPWRSPRPRRASFAERLAALTSPTPSKSRRTSRTPPAATSAPRAHEISDLIDQLARARTRRRPRRGDRLDRPAG